MRLIAAIFLLIWSTLMVQPSFAYFGGKTAYGNCIKKEQIKPSCLKKKSESPGCEKSKTATGCAKKKCSKPSTPQDKKECSTDGCNPTLGCSSGNFYIHHHYEVSVTSWFTQTQKAIATDDNRILNTISEFWHPPEA